MFFGTAFNEPTHMNRLRFIFVLISIPAIVSIANAQAITFCKSVDKEGHAVNAAKEFTLSGSSARIVFLLQFGSVRPALVSYDLYKLENGKEVFSSTLKQSPEPGKNWLSKEVTLYDVATYRVYAFDDKDKVLGKSEFTLKPSPK